MSAIRKELVDAAINRAISLINYDIHNDIHKQDEFIRQTVLADKSLSEDEKAEATVKFFLTMEQEELARIVANSV